MPPISEIYVAVIAVAIFLGNPRKAAYQWFLVLGLSLAAWYGLVQHGGYLAAMQASGSASNPAPWLRANALVASFFPPLLVAIMETVEVDDRKTLRGHLKAAPWLLVALLSWPLILGPGYVSDSPAVRGKAYYGLITLAITLYSVILLRVRRKISLRKGGPRLEYQNLAMVPTLAFLGAQIAFALGHLFQLPAVRRAGLLLPVIGLTLIAFLVHSARIYELGQLARLAAWRTVLVLVASLGLTGMWLLLRSSPEFTLEILTTTGALAATGVWLLRRFPRWIQITRSEPMADLKRRTAEIARSSPRPEEMASAFESLLTDNFQTPKAYLEFKGDNRDHTRSARPKFDFAAFHTESESGWVTPESLSRRGRVTAPKLAHTIAEHAIGLVVITPRSSSTPSLLLALGEKTDGWPYTFPEIERIQQLAELMDNFLTHARLISQTSLKNQVEHLAMMSRGLAHDLKNLITPISSFLIHTESKIAAGSIEEEVHAAAKRSVRIMNEYIREALFFANRLEPRFEPVRTGKIFEAVREITAERARWRGVKIVLAVESDHALEADAILVQRMLGNLVANAIDASSSGQNVALSATIQQGRHVRISIVDQGTGIPPQHLNKVFEPYFTTKEFGDEVRGFGLGLTISQKIAHLHHGTIAVQSQPGVGTAVMVDLPIKQPVPDRMTEQAIASRPRGS